MYWFAYGWLVCIFLVLGASRTARSFDFRSAEYRLFCAIEKYAYAGSGICVIFMVAMIIFGNQCMGS